MSSRLSRSLGIVAIFVLAGPLVGALAFGVFFALFAFADDPEIGLAFVYLAVAFFPLVYLAGGMQALAVGIVTAAAAWRSGRAPLRVTLAAALAVGAVVASRSHEDWGTTFVLLAVHAVSAWACWLLVCRWPGWDAPAPISGN